MCRKLPAMLAIKMNLLQLNNLVKGFKETGGTLRIFIQFDNYFVPHPESYSTCINTSKYTISCLLLLHCLFDFSILFSLITGATFSLCKQTVLAKITVQNHSLLSVR